MNRRNSLPLMLAACVLCLAARGGAAWASADQTAGAPAAPKFKTLAEVTEGFEKVPPSDGGTNSLYTLYVKPKTREVIAALPPDYEKQKLLYGNALAGGSVVSNIQGDTAFVYWKRYGDRLALIQPQLEVRAGEDPVLTRSREQLFSDTVMLDVPIIAEAESNAPVISLDKLFVDESIRFFQFIPGKADARMATIQKVKAFAGNITLSFELPIRVEPGHPSDGQLFTLAYSLSLVPDDSDFKPRKADPRVGYFVTAFDDLTRTGNPDESRQRYIKRWKLEKADATLAMSPPKRPIVFYIDHKTPVRYRRWVREGVLEWNKAFEPIGIVGAIEAYQQDAQTGAHMEKDPENNSFNFVVWNSNNVAFAIGPCRIDPRTGQIVDADVVMNDGWLRAAVQSYRTFLARTMIEGLDRPTLDWIASHPEWDPQQRFGSSAPQDGRDERMIAVRAGRCGDVGYLCSHIETRALDLTLARLLRPALPSGTGNGVEGVPEEFVGNLIKDVIMHEIGHVLGLRHNFAASTVYSLEQINSREWREQSKPIASSVMDYLPVNYNHNDSLEQGPHFMPTIGPYDMWAIRYGYSLETEQAKLDEIVAEASAPQNVYLTDEDLYGPDPRARTGDLGSNVLDFIDTDMALIQDLRAKILNRALKPGDSYQNARDAYMTLLAMHARDITVAARRVGGVLQRRDRVGQTDRNPTEPVGVADQRRALEQIIRYAFTDEAFGLTPALLEKMSFDKWFDRNFIPQDLPDPQLDVHDLVLGLQASALTVLLNPTRLRRIYDSEFRTPADQEAYTVADLLATVQAAIWSELSAEVTTQFTPRKPYISSLRRNLQREHLERMISLTMPNGMTGAVAKPVATLAASLLRQLGQRIELTLQQGRDGVDPYSLAHLEDALMRIERALNAVYVYK